MATLTPNEGQSRGLDILRKWYRDENSRQYIELSGIPGAGKTFLLGLLNDSLGLKKHRVLYVAFVGKAVLLMLIKDLFAMTIHKAIYEMVEEPILGVDGKPLRRADGKKAKHLKKIKKAALDFDIDLMIVDERSMVNRQMEDDLLSFGYKTIFCGDHEQLPPIIGSPYMRPPDIYLDEPMRQKGEGVNVLQIAKTILKGKKPELGTYGESKVIRLSDVTNDMYLNHDMIICGTNATREKLNMHIRKLMNRSHSNLPFHGEKLICRQNNWGLSIGDYINLTNGMVGYAEELHLETKTPRSVEIDFRPEFLDSKSNLSFKNVKLDWNYFTAPYEVKKTIGRSWCNKFEYGYASTVHLAQGSQYKRILVLDEPWGSRDFIRRSRYTAVTRAEDSVTFAISDERW